MKKALLICFLFLLFQATISVVITSCVAQSDSALQSYRLSAIGASLIVCNVLSACAAGFILKGRISAALHWPATYRPTTRIVVLTLATLACLIYVVNALLETLNIPDLLSNEMEGMISDVLCLICMTVIAPVCEEICFRRGVIDAMRAKGYRMGHCIAASALIFGLIHMNPAQALGAGLLGLFLAWLYARTGSLLLPIVCHVVNNSLSVVLSQCFGATAMFQDHLPTAIFYGLIVALLLAGVGLFLSLRKRIAEHTKTE